MESPLQVLLKARHGAVLFLISLHPHSASPFDTIRDLILHNS